MEKIRATQLSGLEKFAGAVFEGAQGKYTLDEYAYFDDTSLFSTANFDLTTLDLAANDEFQLFYTPVGGTGQGFSNAIAAASSSTTLTLADTNLERGWDGGKAPQNMAYVAVAGGFEVYGVDSSGFTRPITNSADMFAITNSIFWTWNVGGDANPRLSYEPITAWPIGSGINAQSTSPAYGATAEAGAVMEFCSNGGPVSTMRKFTFPLFFPPNVGVDCRVKCVRAITLRDGTVAPLTGGNIRVAFHLRGYKLSRIV